MSTHEYTGWSGKRTWKNSIFYFIYQCRRAGLEGAFLIFILIFYLLKLIELLYQEALRSTSRPTALVKSSSSSVVQSTALSVTQANKWSWLQPRSSSTCSTSWIGPTLGCVAVDVVDVVAVVIELIVGPVVGDGALGF